MLKARKSKYVRRKLNQQRGVDLSKAEANNKVGYAFAE